MLPNGIQKLVSLQTLLTFNSGGLPDIFTIVEKISRFNSSAIRLAKTRRFNNGGLRSTNGGLRSPPASLEFPSFDDGWPTESILDYLSQHLDTPASSHSDLFSPNLVACSPHILNFASLWLQQLIIRKNIRNVPSWLWFSLKLTMLELRVEELSCRDVQFLAGLPCLVDLDLTAQATPENIITKRVTTRLGRITHTDNFPKLQKFVLTCDLACLTFEPGAMPQLQILKLDDKKPSNLEEGHGTSGAAQHGKTPLIGIEHLPRLEEVQVTSHSSKVPAYRDAVQRHPRFQDIRATFNIYN